MAATACSRLTYFASPHEATQLIRPCRCTLLRFKLRHSKGFGLPERKEARSIQSLRASVADGPSTSTSTSTLVTQDIIFSWKGQASEVLLTGDFLEWQKQVPLEKSPDGTFQIKQKLAPGSYKYKFIVDGQWMHSPDSPTASDGTGGFNNELIVAESAAGKEAPPPPPAKEKPEKPATKPKPKKPAAKTYPALMVEDVAPRLQAKLAKEENLADVEVCFENDQLRGSFSKLGVPYTFWAYFPDASLEGARGFSVSAYGSPPSTVEPFLIDEKKLTADLIVYWVHKRLFAQNLLELN
ncbi:uncharacterized protein LOC9631897 isoform X2 [Selaginella moellendorffii]|uniref:uncharacterized protein LOC9631897 isoform X2 n=1 Tax=Selaginella moellendorffii TaxID=88036 RepID=UPI000D1CCC7E|nr:uncharacterized protein LOC9631897 isoform X2 [Selaginella moellendorffii]|eukprot:XP_002991569.2 uncharacterized protein LOC9631897 isoform X2 [Selaginella moellendorffii]